MPDHSFLVNEHTLSREIHAGRAPFARMFFTLIPDPEIFDDENPYDENFGGADNDDEVALTDLLTWIRANAATFEIGDANLTADPPVQNRTLTFKEVERIKKVSDRLWQATALYTLREDFATEFDTTGASARIVLSEKTEKAYPYSDSGHGGSGSNSLAPNFKGLINVTEDSVEGVDIIVPKFDWVETHILPIATVTPAYRLLLSTLTGTVNDNVWRNGHPPGFTGFKKGEVLFVGATGRLVGGQDFWEIAYKFSFARNLLGGNDGEDGDDTGKMIPISLSGPFVPADPTHIKKRGWEYLWVMSTEQEFEGETPSGGAPFRALLRQPAYAMIEQVYPYSQFSLLGLPDPP